METIRALILRVNLQVTENIDKWNAPSFALNGEYFATFHARARDCAQMILHPGAKVRDNRTGGIAIRDDAGLLEGLAAERCSLKFRDAADLAEKSAPL